MSNLRIFFVIIFLGLINLTCEKGEELDFPYVAVDLQLNIATDLFNLSINNPVIFSNVGVGGILICKGIDGGYFAFDLACTYEIQKDIVCTIKQSSDVIIFSCPCCGSKFTIDPTGIAYPGDTDSARHILFSYTTSTDGTYVYVIN